ADPPAVRPARVPTLRQHVPHRSEPAGRSRMVRPLRRRAVPARGRPARSHRGPPRAAPARGGAGRGVLPRRRIAARGHGHRRARRRVRPDQAEPRMIMLKSPDEIERMRRASGIVAEILAEVAARARPGVSTAELDALAEELTRKHGSKPAFKGYVVGGRTFPATI